MSIKVLRFNAVLGFFMFGLAAFAFIVAVIYGNEQQRQITLFLCSLGSCVSGFCCLFVSCDAVKVQQNLANATMKAANETQETRKIFAHGGTTKIRRKKHITKIKKFPRVKGKITERISP